MDNSKQRPLNKHVDSIRKSYRNLCDNEEVLRKLQASARQMEARLYAPKVHIIVFQTIILAISGLLMIGLVTIYEKVAGKDCVDLKKQWGSPKDLYAILAESLLEVLGWAVYWIRVFFGWLRDELDLLFTRVIFIVLMALAQLLGVALLIAVIYFVFTH